MAKLVLYIQGMYPVIEELDDLPVYELHSPDDPFLNFEYNCRRRTEYVRHMVADMELRHMRYIVKYKFNYEIQLIIQSKLNEADMNDDLLLYNQA